ncbi:hypothetical protein [Lewinella sp. LCG006]|uniref:hypothetical protein n=1 Tax=Lewinella sp. LCG006 TaxID=3231911 RepID=UPI00346177F6
MTTYTIHAGQKNFRPYEPIWPIWKPGGFSISGKFLPGGWCSEEEWSYKDEQGNIVVDRDIDDWQKIGGITNFWSANSSQTAMFAFSFGKDYETYKITPYTNPKKGRFIAGKPILVESNESWKLDCDFEETQAIYQMASEGSKSPVQTHYFDPFWLGRRVGTFAAGKNNSPGPYGGRAIKKMSIDIEFKITKQ